MAEASRTKHNTELFLMTRSETNPKKCETETNNDFFISPTVKKATNFSKREIAMIIR